MYKRKIDELKQVRDMMIDQAGKGGRWTVEMCVRRIHCEFSDDLPHSEEYLDLMNEIELTFSRRDRQLSTEHMSAKSLVRIINAANERIERLEVRQRPYLTERFG
jgi:hypothetical protein